MFIRKEDSNYSEKNITGENKLKSLESYIRSNIPLANFMDFSIIDLNENSIKLLAPIKPNGNHYNTAFGGSISTLGIVCCWALLHHMMTEDNQKGLIVIQESNTKFLKPARTDFTVECKIDNLDEWGNFKSFLNENGKAKIELISNLYCNNELIAIHNGKYFGLSKPR